MTSSALHPQLFGPILEHTPTPLAVFDQDRKLVFANTAFVALTGTRTALEGTPFARLFDARDVELADQAFCAATGDGDVPAGGHIDARLDQTDPSVWCRIAFSALNEGPDVGLLVVVTFVDITAHQSTVTRLHENSQRYRLAVDQANDIIFNIDLSGRFTFVNPTACLLTQYREEELIGMHYLQLIRDTEREAAERFYTDQVVRRVPSTYYEYPVVKKDGEALWLGQYVQLILEANRPVSIQAIARDISQRRRAEEDLRTSEERLRAVVSNAPIILWATDNDGRLTLCEGQGLSELGVSSGALVGHTVGEVIEDRVIATHLERALAGDACQVELVLGGRIFDSWFSPIRNPGADSGGAIGVAIDVTERQRLQTQLHRVEKIEAVGQLAGGIAHDFNNQLTAILGYSELLMQTLDEKDPRRDDLEEIAKAGQRAAIMTQQLLAYGRKQPRQPKVIDLNAVIASIEPLLRRSVREDVSFETVLDSDVEPIRADPTQIEHVLLNLVLNARDAMTTGGHLTVATRMVNVDAPETRQTPTMPAGRYVSIEVTDTGTGMDESTRLRVFEPFFTTKELGKGTGLGLASVYGIVNQSGGYISVASDIGKGTTFQIHFLPVPAVVDRPDADDASSGGVGGTETILIVEDDPTVRTLAADVLVGRGYNILVAGHPTAALELSNQHQGEIHLLLTDVVMPGMSGRDLAQVFRRLRPTTRVLFTTGHAPDDLVLQHPTEQNQLISKPFGPGALLQRVRDVLDGVATPEGTPPRH